MPNLPADLDLIDTALDRFSDYLDDHGERDYEPDELALLRNRLSTPASIHDLFALVRQHPDFAGGTIWTRDDVANALVPDERYYAGGEAFEEEIAAVTPEQLHSAARILESFIFNGSYTWAEALRHNLDG